jgi:ABC-2 type transport system permease protein
VDEGGAAAVTTTVAHDVAAVRLAGGAWSEELRAARMVWRRELIRFGRNRLRILTSLAQPVLFLFVLGTGLSTIVRGGPVTSGSNFRTFIFPGIVAMTVLFSAIFSAVSIVWDREFGFLREMLVAPIRRSSLVMGKCAGGATVAVLQATIILVLSPLVGIPFSAPLLAILLGEMVLMAIALTALGMVIAARMQQVESFQVVMQFVVLPMFFLSGALFPTTGLPGWLTVLTRLDPLSYAVDPMRRAVFAHHAPSAAHFASISPGLTWFGWLLPVGVELGVVVLVGLVALGIAIVQFSRPD